jgi:hypothetical protein
MAYKQQEEREKRYSKPIINGLTSQGLVELDKELEKYRYEKDIIMPDGTPHHLSLIDDRAWMINKGALNKSGAVMILDFEPAKYNASGHLIKGCDCEPILYEQLTENFEQWKRWKGRAEYAKGIDREAIDALAEDMKIEAPKDW